MSGMFLDDIRRRQAQRAKAAGAKAAAAQTAASTAEEDTGELEKKGLLERGVRWMIPGNVDPIENTVLRTGSLIGKAYDLGGEYVVRPVVGAQAKLGADIGQGDPFTNFLEESVQNPLALVPFGSPSGNERFLKDDEEMDERIRNADGYRDAFDEMYRGRPFEQMAVEMAADPLNAVGVGLVGKAAKAPRIAQLAGRNAALRNTLKYGDKADEILDSIQSAPINLPLKGARKATEKLPALQRSQKAVQRGKENVLRATLRRDGKRTLQPAGQLAGVSEERIITHLETLLAEDAYEAQSFLISLPDAKLGRIVENEQFPQELRQAATRELKQRGHMKAGQRSGQLTAYMQLDRVADQRQLSLDARQLLFDIADIFATAAHNFSPDRFKTIDEAYAEIGAAPVQTTRAADFAASSTQRGDNATAKGVYQPQTGYALFTPLMDATTPVHEILGHMLRYSLNDEEAAAMARMMGGALDNRRFEEAFAEGVENFLRTGDINQFPPQFQPVIERLRQHTGEVYRNGVPAARLTPRAGETLNAALTGPEFGAQSPVTPVTPPAAGQNALPGFLPTQQVQSPAPQMQSPTPQNLQQQRLQQRRAGQQQLPGISNRPTSRNMRPTQYVPLDRKIQAKDAGKKAAATNGVTPRVTGKTTNAEQIANLERQIQAIDTRLSSTALRPPANEILRLRAEQRELRERVAALEERPALPNGMAIAPTSTTTINPTGDARPSNVRQIADADRERINSGSGVFNENLYTEDEVIRLNEMIDQIGTEMEQLREAGYGRGDIDESVVNDLNARIDELKAALDESEEFAAADRAEAQIRIDELRMQLDEVQPKLDEANERVRLLEDQRNELSTLLDSNLKSESRRMWAERKLAEVEAEIQSLYASGAVGGIRGGDPDLVGGLGDGTGEGTGNGSFRRRTVAEREVRRGGVDEYDGVDPASAKAEFDRIIASGEVPDVDDAVYNRVVEAVRKDNKRPKARKPTDKYKQGAVIKDQALDGAKVRITVAEIRKASGVQDNNAIVRSLARWKMENPDAFEGMNLMGQITPAQDERGNVLFQTTGDDIYYAFNGPYAGTDALIGDKGQLSYSGSSTKLIQGLNPQFSIQTVSGNDVPFHKFNQYGEKEWNVEQLPDGAYFILDEDGIPTGAFEVKSGKLTSSGEYDPNAWEDQQDFLEDEEDPNDPNFLSGNTFDNIPFHDINVPPTGATPLQGGPVVSGSLKLTPKPVAAPIPEGDPVAQVEFGTLVDLGSNTQYINSDFGVSLTDAAGNPVSKVPSTGFLEYWSVLTLPDGNYVWDSGIKKTEFTVTSGKITDIANPSSVTYTTPAAKPVPDPATVLADYQKGLISYEDAEKFGAFGTPIPKGSALSVINIMEELDEFGSLSEEMLAIPGTKLYKLDAPKGSVLETVDPNSPYASAYPNWKFDQLEDGHYAFVPPQSGEYFDFTLTNGKVTAVPTGSSKVTYTTTQTPQAVPAAPVAEKGMLAASVNGGDIWELGTSTKYLSLPKGWTLVNEANIGVAPHKQMGSDSEWSIESLQNSWYELIAPDGEIVADFKVHNKWITDVGGSVSYSNPAKPSPSRAKKAIPRYTPGTTPKWDEVPPEPFATSVHNYGDLDYTYSISDPQTLDESDTLGSYADLGNSPSKNWVELPDTLTSNDYLGLQHKSPNTVTNAYYKLAQDREMYRDGGKVHWAVRHYTSSGYDQINGVARGKTGLGGHYYRTGVNLTDDDWKTLARVMDDYIDAREPLTSTVTTFRGVKLYDKSSQEFVEQMQPGFRFSEDGFTSVSTNFETADRIFSGSAPAKTMFRVELPSGTKMAFGFPNEQELILPRGAVFEVKKVSRALDGYGTPFRVVDVTYVGSPKTGEIGIDETLSRPSIVNTPSKFKDPLFQQNRRVQPSNIFSSQDPFGSGRTNNVPLSQARGQQEPISTPREGQLSQLGRDATTGDAVNRIATLAGIQPGGAGEQFVGKQLEEWVGVNPQHFQALELTYPKAAEGFAESMRLAEAGDTDAARELMLNTLDEMNQQNLTFGIRHPNWEKFRKLITNKRNAKASTFVGRDANATEVADHEFEILAEAANNPEIQKFQRDYDTALANVEEVLAEMHAAGKPVAGEISSATSIGWIYDAWKVAEGAQKSTLASYLKLATGKDPEKITSDLSKITEADAFTEGVVTRYHRDWAKKNGIKEKEPSAFVKFLGSAAKMWREQALLSVRYHTVNSLDMTARSLIYGINPAVSSNSARVWASELGEEIPDDILVRGTEIVDGTEVTVGSDMMLGSKKPELSKLPGVAGRLAGGAVEWNRRFSSLVENSARQAAWMKGTKDHLNTVVLPKFNNELTRVLGDTPEVGDITRELAAIEGHVSGQRLFEMLTQRGYNVDQANELSTVWTRGVKEASTAGRDLAKKLHFDYAADTRVIEEKLGLFAVLPFHYWATRNIPFYLDTLAQNPELVRLWQTYDQISDEHREETGLTQRFGGMLPVDTPLTDILFGEGTGYFNPLVAISITDQVKPRYTPEDAHPIAEGLNEAGRVGLSPAPWIVIPLTVAGLYGDRADAPDLLRHSRLIGAGLDVGASKLGIESDVTPTPIRSTVDAVQERLTGKEKFSLTGDAYKDSRVTKLIAEMSIEETGEANHPDYVRAMSDPESEIFKRALGRVNAQMLIEQLYGFTSPVPMKHLPETEADIRLKRKQLADQYGGIRAIPDDVYNQLRESRDISTGYWKSGGDSRGRQVFAGFDRSRGLQKNWDILERRRINEELPFYAQYNAWREQQPAGADTSVDAFTKAT